MMRHLEDNPEQLVQYCTYWLGIRCQKMVAGIVVPLTTVTMKSKLHFVSEKPEFLVFEDVSQKP